MEDVVQNFKTVDNTARVNAIEYSPCFSAICSITHEPFMGTISITYYPDKNLIEYVSFETWLNSLSTKEMLVEDLARLVYDEISKALVGDSVFVEVVVKATTKVHAPVEATVSD